MILFLIVLLIFLFFNNKGIPSILYHQINDKSNVNPELFESHLIYLNDKGYKTITIDEYVSNMYDKRDKNIILTFDDGYFDNYKNAFNLLKKYNMKATIFLNTFYIKNENRVNDIEIEVSDKVNYDAIYDYVCNESDGTSWQYMTWEEIKEMSESGLIDFQAHSHKHMPVFSDIKLKGIHINNKNDTSDIYLYGGLVKEAYPIFPKRGECSVKGYKIDKAFFEIFREYYINSDNKDMKNMRNFVNNNIGKYIVEESIDEAKHRIVDDAKLNKDIIEGKLGKGVHSFCWPWGHKSDFAISILESIGYKNFITTVKGTNSVWGNNKKIRRIELRNFTLKKFILNVEINRNLLLGRLYELIS